MGENHELSNQLSEKGYVKGEITFTIYENHDEQFTIAKIKIHETNEQYDEKEIVGKGHFSQLHKGTTYKFYGKLIHHPKFGTQYDISSYETYIPETKDGLIRYLSSDLFYGIGERIATEIVKTLGENAVEKIIENPNHLNNIPHLSKDTATSFVETLKENQGIEQIAIYLSQFGIGLKTAQTLYKHYKEETIQKLKEDPYQFVYDIEGFGFQTADKIARINGLDEEHPNRIGAGCIFALQMGIEEGHVYLPISNCVESVIALLNTPKITEEKVKKRIVELDEARLIVFKDEKVYLPILYYAEEGFSSHVRRLLEEDVEQKIPTSQLLKYIGQIEEEDIISYGDEQFTAIEQALHSKIMILTGGPGTGKTTVIKGIIKAYSKIHDYSLKVEDYIDQEEFPFILTAPTGRAAKRLQEATNIKTSTIHRLLGWDGNNHFEKNEHNQLKGKIIIIDEFSMVDIWLANHLFKAIPTSMQVILVGDEDQLPSVGPGQVLSDLLDGDFIPMVRLTDVYRQQEGSKIIHLAHAIKNNTCTEKDLQKDKDFSFIPCLSHQVLDAITAIFTRANKSGIHFNDIQVLAPMYKTEAGINKINEHIQNLVNPKASNKRERRVFDVTYRVGDRVIQLVNQPEDGVSNGDIGEIVAIFTAKENVDKEEQVVISFDGNEVVYTRSEYSNFMHAYCISIHKSQGSEFPIVVLPVVRTYRIMLRKNLLYTAITRSTKTLIICGEVNAFMQGINTIDTNLRYTTLKKHLEDKLSREIENDVDERQLHDELSPYDFL